MRCVISDAIEKVFVSFFYYLGLSVEYRFCRQPRRGKPSRRCRSDAVVKPHQELEAYVSFDGGGRFII